MTDPRTVADRDTAIRFIERLGRGVLDLAEEHDDTRRSAETVGALLVRGARRASREEAI